MVREALFSLGGLLGPLFAVETALLFELLGFILVGLVGDTDLVFVVGGTSRKLGGRFCR